MADIERVGGDRVHRDIDHPVVIVRGMEHTAILRLLGDGADAAMIFGDGQLR